ncbi:MAG: GIY-YIG nuclease family protein [Candidatus Jorgensenbacteria bacterium]|nr:GIY-YIG nuclease family protein [Candidatus Jorgensenbacteria bacterium]
MAFVYILVSLRDNSYYVGSCYDVSVRLALHNAGKVRSTKASRPWELKYIERYDTLREARKREDQIKSWKKRSAIENLINRGSAINLGGPIA